MCYNQIMNRDRFVTIITCVSALVLLGMLFFTSPTDIGPAGVLLFFTMVYLVSFGIIMKLWQLFMRLAFKRKDCHSKDYLYAAVLAAAPSLLLIARSFGAITPLMVFLIVFAIALTEFLVSKRA